MLYKLYRHPENSQNQTEAQWQGLSMTTQSFVEKENLAKSTSINAHATFQFHS